MFASESPDTYDTLVRADTVIVPAVRDVHEETPADLVEAVKLAHTNGARIASLCSGAFVLAAAGLLDGRKATTHRLYADATCLVGAGSPLWLFDISIVTSHRERS